MQSLFTFLKGRYFFLSTCLQTSTVKQSTCLATPRTGLGKSGTLIPHPWWPYSNCHYIPYKWVVRSIPHCRPTAISRSSQSSMICAILFVGWSVWRKEGNVLFNDALNTFYLRWYGIGHMVKDHSDRERKTPLPPINSKGSFICTIPDRMAHTTAFVTPVMEHWLEREIAWSV